MNQKYLDIKKQFQDIERQLHDPALVLDHQKLKGINKEYSRLQPAMQWVDELERLEKAKLEAKSTTEQNSEPEMKELAQEELKKIEDKIFEVTQELEKELHEDDPNDKKNVIVEIRAGAGGDEAGLFAADLYRMYSRFAENYGWDNKILSSNRTGIGGFKEIIFLVEGSGVYGKFKFESGVHRVQRIPDTEKSGRIHTSTATVAVLPEAEEVDIHINPNDLKIDTMAAGGAGGQHVNTTNSAVRITHLPTGIVVSCQDERSQGQNKERGMQILRSRLYQMEKERLEKERADARKGQVGTGDRSEKIRTYNVPQDRVTDHRIKLTLHNLEHVLNGDIDQIIESLQEASKQE